MAFLTDAFFEVAFLTDAFFEVAFLADAFFEVAFLTDAFFEVTFPADAFFGVAFLAEAFLPPRVTLAEAVFPRALARLTLLAAIPRPSAAPRDPQGAHLSHRPVGGASRPIPDDLNRGPGCRGGPPPRIRNHRGSR